MEFKFNKNVSVDDAIVKPEDQVMLRKDQQVSWIISKKIEILTRILPLELRHDGYLENCIWCFI